MGFWQRVTAQHHASELIAYIKSGYAEALARNASVEPFEIMVALYRTIGEQMGNSIMVMTADKLAPIFSCLPVPLCLDAMGWHISLSSFKEFEKTKLCQEIGQHVEEIYGLREACDAVRLNELFQTYNPRSYQQYFVVNGTLPFDRKTLMEHRKRRQTG